MLVRLQIGLPIDLICVACKEKLVQIQGTPISKCPKCGIQIAAQAPQQPINPAMMPQLTKGKKSPTMHDLTFSPPSPVA